MTTFNVFIYYLILVTGFYCWEIPLVAIAQVDACGINTLPLKRGVGVSLLSEAELERELEVLGHCPVLYDRHIDSSLTVPGKGAFEKKEPFVGLASSDLKFIGENSSLNYNPHLSHAPSHIPLVQHLL